MSRLVSREPRRVGYFYFSLKSFFTRVGFKWHQRFSTRQGCETVFFYVNSEKPACFDNLRECSNVRLLQVCQVWLQLLTKKCLLCLGKTKHRWLQLSLTQSQHPFSVTWEILDVGMEDGHRSWRWTATRYEVACVRLLDSRDIRASVWVFPTKSNAKIAIGWDELARSVSNKKKVQYATISCSLEKTTIWWKTRDKVDVCRHPCRDSHHQNKTGEVFLFCFQFSSVHFYLAKI